MFDLGSALIPDRSVVLEPAVTLEESKLLGQKIGMNTISSILFKNQAQIQLLKDVDSEIKRFEGVEDLSIIKLLRMVPELDPKVIVEAVAAERSYGERIIESALIEEAA
mmetsp:Transcript_8870/g.10888  ORF Transcript_8870/g.10888 Transcript_8870/m.10888 type:complete len:109 (-) Transcript_8870:713-1039(-)